MEKQHDNDSFLMAATNPTLTFAAAFKLFCEQNDQCNPFTAGCHAFLTYDQTEVLSLKRLVSLSTYTAFRNRGVDSSFCTFSTLSMLTLHSKGTLS